MKRRVLFVALVLAACFAVATAALARPGWNGAGVYAWYLDEDNGPTIYGGPYANEKSCWDAANAAPKNLSVICGYFGSQKEWDEM